MKPASETLAFFQSIIRLLHTILPHLSFPSFLRRGHQCAGSEGCGEGKGGQEYF